MNYIDLHIHLDGSIPADTMFQLAKEEQLDIQAASAEELLPFLTVDSSITSLSDYLAKFDIPLAALRSAHALEASAYALMRRLRDTGVIYSEIRFSPSSHGGKGLSQEAAVKAVLSGVRRGTEDFGIPAKVILCCMRGPVTPELTDIHRTTVALAQKYASEGVCCIDLAGAEALFPTADYRYIFEYAAELGVPYVIHAGEADGVDSVRAAVQFSARRIGHGVSLRDDAELCREVREKHIAVEACITSNLQTRAITAPAEHPLRYYLDSGIPVCLSTDNMTVSGTDMAEEFRIATEAFALSADDILTLQRNAVEASFASPAEKADLLEKLLRQ